MIRAQNVACFINISTHSRTQPGILNIISYNKGEQWGEISLPGNYYIT